MPSIVKVPRYSVYSDYDFIGFSFNGYHCVEDLGIIRVGNGTRYQENLTPQIQEQIGQHPGMDGAYFIGAQYRQKTFDIQFAFDSLTQEQVWKLQEVFSGDNIHDLWFDEYPYKVWDAKVTSQPQLQVIPFDDENGKTIYKGEGTIQFVAYYPYAHTPDYIQWNNDKTEADWKVRDGRLFSSYEPFNNKEQWKEAANLWENGQSLKTDIRGEAPSFINLEIAHPTESVLHINMYIEPRLSTLDINVYKKFVNNYQLEDLVLAVNWYSGTDWATTTQFNIIQSGVYKSEIGSEIGEGDKLKLINFWTEPFIENGEDWEQIYLSYEILGFNIADDNCDSHVQTQAINLDSSQATSCKTVIPSFSKDEQGQAQGLSIQVANFEWPSNSPFKVEMKTVDTKEKVISFLVQHDNLANIEANTRTGLVIGEDFQGNKKLVKYDGKVFGAIEPGKYLVTTSGSSYWLNHHFWYY